MSTPSRRPAGSVSRVELRCTSGALRTRASLCGAFAPLPTIGYTHGMKTAISIADAVYTEAERLARRVKKSRSQLYTEAVAEYVARHDPEAVTEAMNRVCEQLDTRPDPAVSASARRILQRTEW